MAAMGHALPTKPLSQLQFLPPARPGGYPSGRAVRSGLVVGCEVRFVGRQALGVDLFVPIPLKKMPASVLLDQKTWHHSLTHHQPHEKGVVKRKNLVGARACITIHGLSSSAVLVAASSAAPATGTEVLCAGWSRGERGSTCTCKQQKREVAPFIRLGRCGVWA